MFLIFICFWLSSVLVIRVYGEKVKSQYYRWPNWSYLRNHVQTLNSTNTQNITYSDHIDDGLLFFRIIYCLTVIAWCILTGFVHLGNVFYLYNDNALMLNVAPFVMFQLSILFFDIRLVKYEAVSALLALIEAKKTYVRYISHELRTPLSAANSGLQLLHAELSVTSSTNPVDEERLDTLNDVCSAISTTVDILNDLLTFEKMER